MGLGPRTRCHEVPTPPARRAAGMGRGRPSRARRRRRFRGGCGAARRSPLRVTTTGTHCAAALQPNARRQTWVSRTGSGAEALPQRVRRRRAGRGAARGREVVGVQAEPLAHWRLPFAGAVPPSKKPSFGGPRLGLVFLWVEPWIRQATGIRAAIPTIGQRPLARAVSRAVQERVVGAMARASPGTDCGMASRRRRRSLTAWDRCAAGAPQTRQDHQQQHPNPTESCPTESCPERRSARGRAVSRFFGRVGDHRGELRCQETADRRILPEAASYSVIRAPSRWRAGWPW
jgi:hypothetical protein